MSVHKLPSYQRRRPEETLLYKTVATHLNTFLANLAEEGKSLPKHVEKELWAFLECGVLAYGFVRLKCTGCKSEQFVAFSCKKRGFCPSCGGKRMAETAAHLVDNILPRFKIRQYVLSVPIPLRYWMASNKKLLTSVHRLVASIIEGFYINQQGSSSRSGSITFVQRFGAALNLNVHFHLLHLEGYYDTTTRAKFQKGRAPTNQDIQNLVNEISTRLVKFLRKRGYLKDPPDERPTDPLFEQDPTYATCLSASVRHRIALGEREGKRVRFIGSGFGYEGDTPELKGKLCAMVNGFSLHAAVVIPKHRRDQLERLISYTARPSICTDRMSLTPRGDIQYELKKAWRNGVTHVVLSPLELIEKLCALVPLPNLHLVRYCGVLAPNAKFRKQVIPGFTRAELKQKEKDKQNVSNETPSLFKKSSWAKLLSRVFQIDIATCKHCKSEMILISAIKDPIVIKKILDHCGLNPIPPPIAPARYQARLIG